MLYRSITLYNYRMDTRPLYTDRDRYMFLINAIGALSVKITGEPLEVSVKTERGEDLTITLGLAALVRASDRH